MLRWVCCALALSLVACTQNTQAKDEKAKAKEPAGKVKLTPQAAEKALMLPPTEKGQVPVGGAAAIPSRRGRR